MSFAKPIPKAPGNASRGKPGASTGVQARKASGTVKSKPASRTPSVSSTSSTRSGTSTAPVRDSVVSLDGGSSKSSRPPSVSSSRSATPSEDGPESDTPSSARDSEPRTSMARSVPSASDTPQTHQEQNDSGPAATPDPTSDSLQVAAQVYPWIYMTSTLEACFKTAEKSAENDLATRGRELSEEESDISDQRVRLEAERTVEFYEELSSDKFSTEAPSIMQAFLSHGDACTALEADALKLASGPQKPPSASDDDYYSPMRPYNAMLDKLEDLQRELTQLHASILRLTQDAGNEVDSELDEANPDREEPSARSQMIHVFAACLSVLQARAANLEMARELLDGAKENLAMSLHLESLEFSDEEN